MENGKSEKLDVSQIQIRVLSSIIFILIVTKIIIQYDGSLFWNNSKSDSSSFSLSIIPISISSLIYT